MKAIALLGVTALLVAAGVLLYQIRSTQKAVQTIAAGPVDAPPAPASAPGVASPVPVPVPVPAPAPVPVPAPVPAGAPVPANAEVVRPSLPMVPGMAAVRGGGSRFANPMFLSDPEARRGVSAVEAARVAEGGGTPVERRNAVDWLMSNGGAEQYPVLQRVAQGDPDPTVRGAAQVGVNVMQSRFPQFMGH